MKLNPKKNGKGYITSYSVNIGSREARDLNFVDEQGNTKELEKSIDATNSILKIYLKKDK